MPEDVHDPVAAAQRVADPNFVVEGGIHQFGQWLWLEAGLPVGRIHQ